MKNKKKNYFITGGTGSFAKKFVEHLLKNKLASTKALPPNSAFLHK